MNGYGGLMLIPNAVLRRYLNGLAVARYRHGMSQRRSKQRDSNQQGWQQAHP
ncbi:hypothetical protein [Pseudochelatococcus contaminans]|uniref:hypothetical protein n=1 Tax=Pseudochelatococcus contaminans TaxID=1538103 RepID=UPI0016141871|nr:hypothetical protein [Pseudochelatococcus contaminans]